MAVRREAVIGSLLGTAVGDALGLPAEGLSPRRQSRIFPDPGRHHFVLGHGMVSDDTEHACLTAQSLITSAGNHERFAGELARRLRWWFAALPAGIGRATALACLKLWLGYSPGRSGVYSAGNGPAMRSPLLGVCLGHELDRLRWLVKESTRITHTDPKAESGALTVALAAHTAASHEPRRAAEVFSTLFRAQAARITPDLLEQLRCVETSIARGQSTPDFAVERGFRKGVSGYIVHTVPIAVHSWLSHPAEFRPAVIDAIRCGGDTDTVAAIVGGIVGAGVGKSGIPAEWLQRLWEWPRSVDWMERLGDRLTQVTNDGKPHSALPLNVWAIPVRNLLFLAIVLVHGFRRLLPPY